MDDAGIEEMSLLANPVVELGLLLSLVEKSDQRDPRKNTNHQS